MKSKADTGVDIFVRFNTNDGMPPSGAVNPVVSEAEFESEDGVDRRGDFSANDPRSSSLPAGTAKPGRRARLSRREVTAA